MRKALSLALLAVALAASASAAQPAAGSHLGRFELSRLSAGPVAFRSPVLHGSRLPAAAERVAFWGGQVTASDGEVVAIYVSDAVPQDPAFTQSVADFLTQLYHGSELQAVSFYLEPLDELQRICGPNTAGCYDADRTAIFGPAGDLPDGTSKETVLVHELGHHVATSRLNPPWAAVDWGTKRWASYMNVCSRVVEGTAFPGDEADKYPLNPGEAFAETYRLLNYQKQAWANWALTPWNVDQTFYPDPAALELAKEDVLQPWTGPTGTTWAGRLAKPKATKKRVITTPLDGTLNVKLVRAPRGTTVSVSDPSTGAALTKKSNRAVSTTVCGQRSLVLTLRAGKAVGRFSAALSTP